MQYALTLGQDPDNHRHKINLRGWDFEKGKESTHETPEHSARAVFDLSSSERLISGARKEVQLLSSFYR